MAGEIRETLTSGDASIQRNNLTSVYLDYINMLEKRETASKDAPTKEVKDNVTKIYNEVNRSGMFSSLTESIRGMFNNRRSDTNKDGVKTSQENNPQTTRSLLLQVADKLQDKACGLNK